MAGGEHEVFSISRDRLDSGRKFKALTSRSFPNLFYDDGNHHAPVQSDTKDEPSLVPVCPVDADLRVFGKRWTLSILRGIQTGKAERFSQIMKSNKGLSPRVLSRRLQELEAIGILTRTKESDAVNVVRWKLTQNGRKVLPKHLF
jgi:DNA-binding HxlR family transcriptional regulator